MSDAGTYTELTELNYLKHLIEETQIGETDCSEQVIEEQRITEMQCMRTCERGTALP